MKMRKFVGQSFKEALETVKKELGPDAIILSSKTLKSGPFGMFDKGGVEVTVALDDTVSLSTSDSEPTTDSDEILKELKGLRDEIGYLKETLRPIVPMLRIGREKKGLYNLLISQGVDPQFALVLVERAQDSIESLKEVIKGDLRTQQGGLSDDRGMVFLGPPGVGKTTTLSKIAHIYAQKRKKVSLITLDHKRVGAITTLKDLSRHLRCQLNVLKSVSELPKVIYKEVEKGPVLIDTPGYSYKELSKELQEIFPSGLPMKKCFLMDATMNPQSAFTTWQSSESSSIDSLTFTKLDMTSTYGALYNLSMLTNRPLSFITTGPEVTGDIRIPSPDFLANLIIGGV